MCAAEVSITELVDGLRSLAPGDFEREPVLDLLRRHPIDPDSLDPYLYFSSKRYTRNLIYRDDAFEMIALCWAPGQISAIHDHAGQRCWMVVPIGALEVQCFTVVEARGQSAASALAKASHGFIDRGAPAAVTDDEPIHWVGNTKDDLATSIHVYARPIERCTAFDVDRDRTWEVPLSYYSRYGVVCDGPEPAPPERK